jgi:tetratricopeptide (TPR) repeat protein
LGFAVVAALILAAGFLAPRTANDERALCLAIDDDADADAFRKAIDFCTARIRSGQESRESLVSLYEHRALAYGESDQDKQAIADYSQAIRLDGTRANAWYQRGLLEDGMKDRARAIADYTAALTLDPGLSAAYGARGEAYFQEGDFARAVADARQMLDALHSAANLNTLCWYRGAWNQELKEALQDCDEAIRLSPKFAAALDSRAFIHLRLGDARAAIADYDAALKIRPDLASSLFGRGLARRAAGDTMGGDQDIAAARKKESDIGDLYAHMGVKI